MTLFQTYARAIGMLKAERGLAISLAVANCALAVVALAEPLLFGRVVDALSKQQDTWATIAAWGQAGAHSPQPSQRAGSIPRRSSSITHAAVGQASTQRWQLACSMRLWTQRSARTCGR